MQTCLMTKILQPQYFNSGFCKSIETTPGVTIGAAYVSIPILCSIPLLTPLPPLQPPHHAPLPRSSFPPSPSSSSTTPPPYNVLLEIWDTNGVHPRNNMDLIPGLYLRNAHAVMIVYDVTHPLTFFDGVDVWRQLTIKHAPTALILLAALKVDMPRKVPQETAMKYAQENNMAYPNFNTFSLFPSPPSLLLPPLLPLFYFYLLFFILWNMKIC